jgi:pantothenate kinase type III
MRDYQIISPSLEGVLSHTSVVYEGLKRPIEIFRVLDGPSSRGKGGTLCTSDNRKILDEYFQDLYVVFNKKLSDFAVSSVTDPVHTLKLQAMLQEMIKVKRLVARGDLAK